MSELSGESSEHADALQQDVTWVQRQCAGMHEVRNAAVCGFSPSQAENPAESCSVACPNSLPGTSQGL